MKIAVWHNLPSGGGKRALYYHIRGLVERGHTVDAWCPPTADQTYLPLKALIPEKLVHLAPEPWAEIPLRRGSLYSEKELVSQLMDPPVDLIAQIEAMDEHCRRCAEEINQGGYDLLFANACRFFRTTAIGRYMTIPTTLYLQEPFRQLYEALPQLPWIALPPTDGTQAYRQNFIDDLVNLQAFRVQAREELQSTAAFDKVLVNSYYSRESIWRTYGLDSEVCYLGIDSELFVDQNKPDEDFVVGLGSIVPEKNIELALESLAAMPQPRPPLVWIGNAANPYCLDDMTQLAEELEVEFIPKVAITDSEVVDILNRARVMIYAPRLEPFGLAPLEANSCGTPVVAVAEGGVRETIVDGVNGLLVGNDPHAVGAAIQSLFDDTEYADQLGQNGRQIVAERWSLSASIDRLERSLEETITRWAQENGSQKHAVGEQSDAQDRAVREVAPVAVQNHDLDEGVGHSPAPISEADALESQLQTTDDSQQQALASIYASRGWRMLVLYWHFMDWLIPIGSKRRDYIESIIGARKRADQGTADASEIQTEQLNPSNFQAPAFSQQQNMASVYASRGWKTLVLYWKLMDWLVPADSRRRAFVEWVVNLVSRKKKGGTAPLDQNFETDRRDPVPTTPPPFPSPGETKKVENSSHHDVTISAVIVTKNGGDDLHHLLAMLNDQKGFEQVEFVIVDTGSTDNTIEIATNFSAKIVQIGPESFTQATARNLGAEHAVGNFLLFTVQNALPATDQWLNELFSVFTYSSEVTAVSCVEIPREDADLFSRFFSWNNINWQNMLVNLTQDNGYANLRKKDALSESACLIPKEIFMDYQFRGNHTHCLDLGDRLIRDGRKLAYLDSTGIIHSKIQPPFYFFKRGFEEALELSSILADYPTPIIDDERLWDDLVGTYQIVRNIVDNYLPQLALPCNIHKLSTLIENSFLAAGDQCFQTKIEIENSRYIDSEFKAFLKGVNERHHINGKLDFDDDGMIITTTKGLINKIMQYMENSYELVDKAILEDLKWALFKAYAWTCGMSLASTYKHGTGSAREPVADIAADFVMRSQL